MIAGRSLGARWIISGLGLLAAVAIVPGLHYQGGALAFLVLALILGLLNALLKPVLALLTCPLLLLTLGMFMLVLNGVLLLLAGALGRTIGIQFYVDGFGSAFLGGLVISIVSFLASAMTRDRPLR
jgi:putative membrane protein